jgi:GTP pyrophosphokinase
MNVHNSPQSIAAYRLNYIEYINQNGNISIKKNADKILEAYNQTQEILQLTRDEYDIIQLEKVQFITEILVDELNLGSKSVISSMFYLCRHNLIYDFEEISQVYGERIASIVKALSRVPNKVSENQKNKAEQVRNLLFTISFDARVILVILAIKLHEIRILANRNSSLAAKEVASETLEIYAPVAHRIGLYEVKTELEDLSFKIFQPDIYRYISDRLDGSEQKRMLSINRFTVPIMQALDNLGYKYEIDGRVKSVYSIWNKMQKKHVTFDEIYDIYAIRIVFQAQENITEAAQCWNIFSIITQMYTPKIDRLRNWVSKPKENGYEALHITLRSDDQKWVEVQIRSKRMDDLASLGIAAHWKYKGDSTEETAFDRLVQQLKDLKDTNSESTYELLDNFKSNIFYEDIYVFTPKNEILKLKSNSTVLDFAFHIHTDIGLRCIGAKVNHKSVPPEHVLLSGDKVQILTAEKQHLKKEWVNLVKTDKARENLKQAFRTERKNIVRQGLRILEELTLQENIFFDNYIFRKLAKHFSAQTKEQLYFKIGNGEISAEQILLVLSERSKEKKINFWKIIPVQKTEQQDINIEIGQCCLPLPGNDIIGLKSNNTIVAHKHSCSIAESVLEIYPNRRIKIKWKSCKEEAKLVVIYFHGIDHSGIVNRVTSIIINEINITMRSIHFETDQRNFKGSVELYIPKNFVINDLLYRLTLIKGMKKVERR